MPGKKHDPLTRAGKLAKQKKLLEDKIRAKRLALGLKDARSRMRKVGTAGLFNYSNFMKDEKRADVLKPDMIALKIGKMVIGFYGAKLLAIKRESILFCCTDETMNKAAKRNLTHFKRLCFAKPPASIIAVEQKKLETILASAVVVPL